MKEITLEEKKIILLDILKNIHEFCSSNNLHYSLAYGTLLGAIRHKGFIPWDDDIDICMPRKDFEIFESKFNSHNSRYRLITINNNSNYNLFVAKIIDTETTLTEDVNEPFELGVYIDLFIIDNLPDDKKEFDRSIRKLTHLHRLYVLKTVKINSQRKFYKNAVLWFSQILLKGISVRKILLDMNRYSKSLSSESSRYCGALSSFAYEKKEIMKSKWYESYSLVPFENEMFYIPVGYHDILTRLYSDYMIPPPKEKQNTHHANKAYWKTTNKM